MMPQNGEYIVRDLSEVYDAMAGEYDQRYRNLIHYVEDEIIGQFLGHLYAPGMSVLDVGCGTGNMITVGHLEPEDYTGIDVSANMLNQARDKFPNHAHGLINHDATVGLNGKWDIIIAVFGVVNYIGLDQWVKLIRQNLTAEGNWMAVMYSDCYKPSYINGEAFSYGLRDVESELRGAGIPFECYGLSFPFQQEEGDDFDTVMMQQSTLTKFSTSNCRYWVLIG